MQDMQTYRGRDSKLVRLHTKRTQSCNETHQGGRDSKLVRLHTKRTQS
jgi:hypothetical protein